MISTLHRLVIGFLIIIIIWLIFGLVRSHKKYKKLEQERETFLLNISHDLRTPMNVVVGFTELAKWHVDNPKRTTEYLDKIEESSKQLLGLIDDIMEMGSMESAEVITDDNDDKAKNLVLAGKRILLVEDNALNCELAKVILEDEGILVEFAENGTKALEKIRNNPAGYFCFVLMDLHMPIMDGFTATTHIRVMNDKEKATIPIIAMSATGLAEDKRQALKHGMNGFIHKPIDMVALKSLLLTILNVECANKSFIAPDAKILLVDDNPMNIRIEKELLSDFQFHIDCAVNGAEAIEMLKSVRYDLVFMDYMMPIMDGIEATKVIRSIDDPYYQALPIVALTANAIPEAQKKFRQAGMNDFLSKPVQMIEVSRVLRRWLPKHYIKEVDAQTASEEKKITEHKLQIPGIDVQAGIANCMNEKLFRELLRDFHGLIEEKSNRIERFLEERDIRNFTIEVHAMKSSARMIGALELSDRFKALEELGIIENVSLINQLAPGVLQSYRKYRDLLKPFVVTAPVEKKELPKEEVISMLERLEKAMDEFDLDTADETMKELEKVIFDDEMKKQLEQLKVYLLDVAIEDVLKLSRQMIDKMKE
ncbi:MAG: response regulator [Lachnospiraceae bacterium]|nr:response regulator [Lachnospiraceae bacterium]